MGQPVVNQQFYDLESRTGHSLEVATLLWLFLFKQDQWKQMNTQGTKDEVRRMAAKYALAPTKHTIHLLESKNLGLVGFTIDAHMKRSLKDLAIELKSEVGVFLVYISSRNIHICSRMTHYGTGRRYFRSTADIGDLRSMVTDLATLEIFL